MTLRIKRRNVLIGIRGNSKGKWGNTAVPGESDRAKSGRTALLDGRSRPVQNDVTGKASGRRIKMFQLPETYTRQEIYEQLGGSKEAFLRSLAAVSFVLAFERTRTLMPRT
jgi:hypothetical protein